MREVQEAQVWLRILCDNFNQPVVDWKLMLKSLSLWRLNVKATAVKNYNESLTTTCAGVDRSSTHWSWLFSWTERATTQWWKKWWCSSAVLLKLSLQEMQASLFLLKQQTSWDRLTARWVATCTTWSSPRFLMTSTVCLSALMFVTLDLNQLLVSQLLLTVRCLSTSTIT